MALLHAFKKRKQDSNQVVPVRPLRRQMCDKVCVEGCLCRCADTQDVAVCLCTGLGTHRYVAWGLHV